jgi:hypothetical protein
VTGPDHATRLLVAELTGEARHHARWRDPSEEETAAAVRELREITRGREDGPALLAQVAGILEGAHPDSKRDLVAASFCREAGADEALIPGWQETGRQRRAAAEVPPFGMPLPGSDEE